MTIRPTAFPSVRPDALRPDAARADAASRPEPTPRTAEPAAQAAASAAPGGLSSAERQALAQAFPETPTLALRLYGPQRGAAAPAPALGSRLDLRG